MNVKAAYPTTQAATPIAIDAMENASRLFGKAAAHIQQSQEDMVNNGLRPDCAVGGILALEQQRLICVRAIDRFCSAINRALAAHDTIIANVYQHEKI